MTEDLDCALLADDLSDGPMAERLAMDFVEDLRDLGFSRSEDWRASRKGRFSYPHSTDGVAVEFLCGDVPVGEASRRPPAWRIAAVPDGPSPFYAAKVPWLDFVEEWIAVRTTCGARVFQPRIPDLSGLAVLKVRAVVDKTRRVDEEAKPDVLEHETLRLERHARDCVSLFDWIDRRGEFDRLARIATRQVEVRSTAREGARWVLRREKLVEELDLARLGPALERLVPPVA